VITSSRTAVGPVRILCPATTSDRIWVGRCECAACQGRSFPHVYLQTVLEHRRKDSWIARRRKVRAGETLPKPIAYECLLESMYGLIRKAPRVGSLDTTESGSAQGMRWLADSHAAGVVVDLHEAELEPDSDAAIEREMLMYASLEAYLVALGVDETEKAARMRRCRDLCAMWPGDRHRRRLRQWLCAEFPGWLTDGVPV
jgi:hypothetical protein